MATCMFNSIAKSNIGNIYLNAASANKFFNINGLEMTTSSVANYMPLFKKKIGPNKPLKVFFRPYDIKITLGQFDCDVIFDYTLYYEISLDNANGTMLISDNVKFITSADLSTNNDVLDIKVLDHKINKD